MHSETRVYETKPEGFSPKVEVAATCVHVNGRLLLLEYGPNKPETGKWGIPAGKLETDEEPGQGALRELLEETGIAIPPESLQSLEPLYIRKPDVDYVFHLFCVHFSDFPQVLLSSEHKSWKWVSKEEAETLPLMKGAKEVLDLLFLKVEKQPVIFSS